MITSKHTEYSFKIYKKKHLQLSLFTLEKKTENQSAKSSIQKVREATYKQI